MECLVTPPRLTRRKFSRSSRKYLLLVSESNTRINSSELLVFTDKRLFVDKQGMTGSKVAYHSIPYKSITHFSIETAGPFWMRTEGLDFWRATFSAPVQQEIEHLRSPSRARQLCAQVTRQT